MEIKLRQYVIIPRRPKMSAGKIASQTAHCTFEALYKQSKLVDDTYTPSEDGKVCGHCEWDNVEEWRENGMCVIVLECPSQVELMNIAKYFEQWGIPHHLYIDEGLTEIPMGTATALATGVLPEKYHWMLGQLKLYNDKPKLKKKKGWFK